MTEDELQKLAELVADKVELKLRREGHWPTPQVWQPLPEIPQWWQPGGGPMCIASGQSVSTTNPYFSWN